MKKYDNYKDSGIAWIGDIPEHWRIGKLKFFCNKITDGSHYSPPTLEKGKRYLSVKDIGNNELLFDDCKRISEEEFDLLVKNGCQPIKGDILLTKDGTIGRAVIVQDDNDFVVLSSLGIIRPNKNKFNSTFLREFLVSDLNVEQMLSLLKGSALTRITINVINGLLVTYPPIEEQAQIAKYLEHKNTQLDNLIAKKEQFITLLQEERTAVINQAVTKGLDPKVKMKDSGIEWLGNIPEHWEIKKLKLLANIQGRIGFKGYTVGDLVSKGEGALTLGAKHIDKKNQLNLSDPEFISWDKYYESPEIMVQIGDIILTQRGTLGKVILVTEDIGKATINPSMVILSKLKANDFFLYYFFNSDYFKSWIDLTNTATAVPMISQGQLGNLKLVLPNIDEQNQIVNSIQKSIKKIDDIIVKALHEIELLKEYKTALISEVVTGKVDVREVVLN